MRIASAILCGELFVGAVDLRDVVVQEPCNPTGDGENEVPSWYAEEFARGNPGTITHLRGSGSKAPRPCGGKKSPAPKDPLEMDPRAGQVVYGTCFDACGDCERMAYASGEMTCECVVHCFKGSSRLVDCDEGGLDGWTRNVPTVITEEWSANCKDSVLTPLPQPTIACSKICSSMPYG